MRSRVCRSIAVAAAASMMALVAKPAAGQLAGRLSGLGTFAPVDAAALGVTRPASVGLFAGAFSLVGAAGLGFDKGALRGFVGGFEGDWSFGAGYARTLAIGQLGTRSIPASAASSLAPTGASRARPAPSPRTRPCHSA